MVPRFVFATLLALLAVLTVGFGVLMGGFCIASAAGDAAGAHGIRSVAMACALLLVTDALLLLGALGLEQLERMKVPPAKPWNTRGDDESSSEKTTD